jgi:hypothetical protein
MLFHLHRRIDDSVDLFILRGDFSFVVVDRFPPRFDFRFLRVEQLNGRFFS